MFAGRVPGSSPLSLLERRIRACRGEASSAASRVRFESEYDGDRIEEAEVLLVSDCRGFEVGESGPFEGVGCFCATSIGGVTVESPGVADSRSAPSSFRWLCRLGEGNGCRSGQKTGVSKI